jgi:hypothetical protein
MTPRNAEPALANRLLEMDEIIVLDQPNANWKVPVRHLKTLLGPDSTALVPR